MNFLSPWKAAAEAARRWQPGWFQRCFCHFPPQLSTSRIIPVLADWKLSAAETMCKNIGEATQPPPDTLCSSAHEGIVLHFKSHLSKLPLVGPPTFSQQQNIWFQGVIWVTSVELTDSTTHCCNVPSIPKRLQAVCDSDNCHSGKREEGRRSVWQEKLAQLSWISTDKERKRETTTFSQPPSIKPTNIPRCWPSGGGWRGLWGDVAPADIVRVTRFLKPKTGTLLFFFKHQKIAKIWSP